MELNKDIDQIDIPLAKRTYLNNPNSTLLKKLLIFSPFLFLIFSIAALRFIRNVELIPLSNLKFEVKRNHNARILGHLPYEETPKEKLVLIEPNIEVHMDMRDSLPSRGLGDVYKRQCQKNLLKQPKFNIIKKIINIFSISFPYIFYRCIAIY